MDQSFIDGRPGMYVASASASAASVEEDLQEFLEAQEKRLEAAQSRLTYWAELDARRGLSSDSPS